MSNPRRTALGLLAAGSIGLGCAAGDGSPLNEGAVCATDDVYVAEHCGETFCGLPAVAVGTGADRFERLEQGDEVDIMFGSQGGYHLDIAAQMTRLCPIVYVRASLWLDPGDGELEELFDGERHMEAVRTEEDSSQDVWGVRAFIPCRHWPDTTLACSGGAGSDGHLEDFEVVLRVEAEDHNGRIGTGEQRVQPVCCEG